MVEDTQLRAFYIIQSGDTSGQSARGPYSMAEAEALAQDQERIITRTQYAALRETSNEPQTSEAPLRPVYEKMVKENRSWGIMLLILGVFSVVSNGFLSASWGYLLIIVGLASFYFRSAAMFAIYGVTLSWAAISNALSGSGSWLVFALFQVVLALQTFRQFFRFRRVQLALEAAQQPIHDRAARPFPWLSLVLGVGSFGALVVLLVLIVFLLGVGLATAETLPGFLDLAEGMIISFAVLGFAMGLGGIFLKYRYKLLSIAGMISAGLVLLIEVGFNLLG
ncbi:MAG: hypothetical protein KC441_06295 [Anaerolineales bacterium]|nr:hypothetical protein [Anaerolineales bacterium]